MEARTWSGGLCRDPGNGWRDEAVWTRVALVEVVSGGCWLRFKGRADGFAEGLYVEWEKTKIPRKLQGF